MPVTPTITFRADDATREAIASLVGSYGAGANTSTVLEAAAIGWRLALVDGSRRVLGLLVREEWNYLATITTSRGLEVYERWAHPGSLLALEVDNADPSREALRDKLAACDHALAWTVLLALKWFHEH